MGNQPAKETKQKIAILGGGVSAVTAAFELTSQPDWQNKYDITLYQLGWRLGGKGASGRNPADHERIEEHGIHVWFGFYYNSFHALRQCYEELGRAPDQPLATLDEAFKPHPSTAFAQLFNKQWKVWPINTVSLPGEVGEGWNPKPFMESVATILSWLLDHTEKDEEKREVAGFHIPFFQRLEDEVESFLSNDVMGTILSKLKEVKDKLTDWIPDDDDDQDKEQHGILIALLEGARELLRDITSPFMHLSVKVSRFWMMMDFGLTTVIGLLKGEIYKNGLNSINHINFKDWLAEYGASEETLEGPIMASLYGGIFAYKDGDTTQPNVEAGTVLRAGMIAVTCSKESFVWRMQAGMGDVVFAPYYEVLKRRGVQFKFFHQVQSLEAVNEDGRQYIKQIRIAKQVPLKDEAQGYQPLVDVKGLPCWPSEPRYDQIPDDVVAKLKANNINLESFWSNWSEIYPQEEILLEAGQDYDQVILGISVASLKYLCPSLMTLNPKFDQMVNNISTVCTQAYQLWLNKDVEELGWPEYEPDELPPEILGYNADNLAGKPQGLDSWADVSYLVERETWPPADAPKDISYFCGVFAPDAAPPAPNPAYPVQEKAKVRANVVEQLENTIGFLWPNANPSAGEFRWDYLVAPEADQGEDRLNAQYWRANIDPSERYVQSTVNTTIYRLKTDETGFDNLLITGDWIRNGFNMGCVESATISGLQTARAIKGTDEEIPGEAELW